MAITKYLPSLDAKWIIKWLAAGLLWLVETGIKLLALVSGTLALASPGSFGEKVGNGFGSLPGGLRSLFAAPAELFRFGQAARDYSAMSPAEFEGAFSQAMIVDFMRFFGESTAFFESAAENLASQPLTAASSALVVFGTFWMLARIVRFSRQMGRGPALVRLEQKLGRYLFKRPKLVPEKVVSEKAKPTENSRPQPASRPKSKFKSRTNGKSATRIKSGSDSGGKAEGNAGKSKPGKTKKPDFDRDSGNPDSIKKTAEQIEQKGTQKKKTKKPPANLESADEYEPESNKREGDDREKPARRNKRKRKRSKPTYESLSQALKDARSS